jgi:hypothetical protein
MEQKNLEINPIATRVARGITALQKQALKVLDTWFGPQSGAQWAHPPDKPFVTQRSGTSVPLRPARASSNMSAQNDSKVAGNKAAQDGGFKRQWDGNHSVDKTVPEGTKITQPPPEPHVKALAPSAKNLPQRLPAVTEPPPPPPAVKPPSTQLELPFETGLPSSKPQVCIPESPPTIEVPPVGGSLGKTMLLTGLKSIGDVFAVKGAIDDFEEEDYFGAGLNVASLASGSLGIISGAYHLQKAETMAYGAILNAGVDSAKMYTLYIQGLATAEDVVKSHVDLSNWPQEDVEDIKRAWFNNE